VQCGFKNIRTPVVVAGPYFGILHQTSSNNIYIKSFFPRKPVNGPCRENSINYTIHCTMAKGGDDELTIYMHTAGVHVQPSIRTTTGGQMSHTMMLLKMVGTMLIFNFRKNVIIQHLEFTNGRYIRHNNTIILEHHLQTLCIR